MGWSATRDRAANEQGVSKPRAPGNPRCFESDDPIRWCGDGSHRGRVHPSSLLIFSPRVSLVV